MQVLSPFSLTADLLVISDIKVSIILLKTKNYLQQISVQMT